MKKSSTLTNFNPVPNILFAVLIGILVFEVSTETVNNRSIEKQPSTLESDEHSKFYETQSPRDIDQGNGLIGRNYLLELNRSQKKIVQH